MDGGRSRAWPLQRYFGAVGVVVLLAGAAAGVLVYVQSISDTRQDAIADAGLAAKKAAAQIASALQIIDSTSEATVASDSTVRAVFAAPQKCQLGYAPVGAFDTGRIEFIRLDGEVICSSDKGATGRRYAGEPWLGTTQRRVIAPLADPLNGHQVALMLYPAADLGFLAWFVDLQGIGPKLNAEFGSGVHQLEFVVISSNGRSIVTRSVDSAIWTGRAIDSTPFANEADATDRKDVGGTPRWYAKADVPATGWTVYVGADSAEAISAEATLQQREIAIIAAGVIVTLLALLFVYRQVARPMADLGRAVRASHAGDSAIVPAGPAEVARLAADINELIVALKREGAERQSAEHSLDTAHRRYDELFEGNPLASMILRPHTLEIVEANEAAVRILGYSREELKKLRTSDLMVPDNPDQARAIQRNRETEASTMRFGPISFRRKDGALTRFVGTSYVVDYRGERVRVAMLEDVTEKEKIERQMQQAQRLEALGQLAGGVAHDFNNLLTVILNVTASLRSAVGDPEAARDVERVDKAAQSARRLTRQLLAFARLEVVPLSALNVNEQLTELRDLLARTIGSHIDLVLDLDAEAAPVRMDRGQLEQVVINLSVNARDAMPKGGRLVISTRNFDVDDAFVGAGRDLSTGRYLRLQIGDSGSGMDKSTLDHAFEPFFTTKPVGQGTGMGLATVYGIVKQLKGHVSIYSEVGVGTTVTVLLPATDAPVRSAVVAPVAYTGPVSGTVLVVEDYSDLRELFDDFLTNAGYTVLVAGDGRAALEMAEQHRDRIDLLLTDIVMPNMLGTDLAAELKMKRPALRVLYMSGHAQPIFSGATPLPDGVKLLQKPFLESELLDSIREVMAAPAIDEVHV